MPSAQVQSYIPFPFESGGLLCTPNFMACGSDGQFMVAAQVIWQSSNSELWVYSLPRPSDRPRAFSQKRNSYPPRMAGLCSKNPKELCCDSPVGACHSRQHPYLLLPLQVPLDLLDHMIQKAACTSAWTFAEPCVALGPTEN